MVIRSLPTCRILLLLLALGAAVAHAGVTARVDREQLSLNESLQLTILITGSLDADAPDTSELERNFEILERRRSSRLSIGSGQRERATEWQITLVPRRSGRLQIPPLTIAGQSTKAIEVTVEGGSPATSGSGDIRLEVRTDTDELRVQQQLLITVRVLHAVDLNRGATLEPLTIDGAVVSELGEHTYTRTIDGQRFAAFERRYAVFPQHSGELLIPSLGFRASLGGTGGWFDQFGARAIRLRSQEKRLRVLPPVDQATPWLPARVLTLIETWDKDPEGLHVGDSATRTITLSARGLTAAQLPPLPTMAVDGLRFYPDQPRLEDTPGDNGVSSTRTESAAVIPERAGTLVLPPVELRWWSTVDHHFETAVIPERTLEILPAPAATNTPVPPADMSTATRAAVPATDVNNASGDLVDARHSVTNPSLPWMVATLLFALGTLFTGWHWWRATQRLRTAFPQLPATDLLPDEGAAFAALQTACAEADPERIRNALRAWGISALPDHHIYSANDVVAATQDAVLANEFRQLLASAYGPQESRFDAAALFTRVRVLRGGLRDASKRDDQVGGLPPLYPQRTGKR